MSKRKCCPRWLAHSCGRNVRRPVDVLADLRNAIMPMMLLPDQLAAVTPDTQAEVWRDYEESRNRVRVLLDELNASVAHI
jgi:hypothetical protein